MEFGNQLQPLFNIVKYWSFFHFSVLPRSTHETFAQKLYQTFKDHKRFSKPKLALTDFTICHYAGDVWIFASCYLINYADSI